MSPVKDAADALVAALKLVPGIGEYVHTDPAAARRRPCLVVDAPSLTFVAYRKGPTDARFTVFAVVDTGPRAAEELWQLVPNVVAAVEEHTAASVSGEAEPITYEIGADKLPAYAITVEYPLEGQ